MVPAAIVLDRRLASALEDRARIDLALAPRVLADRMAANATTYMMYAKDLAHTAGLASAVARGDRSSAVATLGAASAALAAAPVLIGPRGDSWTGPAVDSALIARTRAGQMPVVTHRTGRSISNIALAPIERDGRWVGAAGVAVAFDERLAGTLSGLTRAGVVLLGDSVGPVASTLDSVTTVALTNAVGRAAIDSVPRELRARDHRLLAVAARLDGAGTAVFARRLDEEMAVLPELRRVAAASAIAALLIAIALGAALATKVARPVQQLAGAAAALGAGDLAAPVPSSSIREVDQVGTAFSEMRSALAARLAELRDANAALTDRNARLTALQMDLMQRDRLVAAGRLVAQLAHEIRNPVASLRNCLELIRRRVEHDAEAREFADLAIDELLRMHELAEQMLDLARPREPGASRCAAVLVAREVARLASVAPALERPAVVVDVSGDEDAEAAIAPDALKQVLVNLVQNSGDANTSDESMAVGIVIRDRGTHVSVDVMDNGPGISSDILNRVFDPFFTTKGAVHGVGLGLFVAEGLVRSAGGSIAARNAGSAPGTRYGGAWFHIELPVPNGSVMRGAGDPPASARVTSDAHD